MSRRRAIQIGAASTALGLSACGSSPRAQSNGTLSSGLWVPPEEHTHERTVMQWPVSRRVYRDAEFLRITQDAIAETASTIAEFEPVWLLADQSLHSTIRARVSGNVELLSIPTDDLWARDAGPLIAMQGEKRVVSHIQFNGWGDKQTHENDGKIAKRLADVLGFDMVPSGLVGEAGGVEHSGRDLLAHESSWVNRNRNPGMSKQEIGDRLLAAYGAERILWTKGVYDLDITDYHIDSLARFTSEETVLVNIPAIDDESDPFLIAALETLDAIERAGYKTTVIDEPSSPRVKSDDFVAAYTNYYVCNGAVIMAQFGDQEADKAALEAIARAYPDREVVALNVDPLGELGGGIHCATQQIPA